MAPSLWAQNQQNQNPPPMPDGMLAPVNMGDPGVDLHAGLAKIFPPAPQVTLDQDPQHQIQGAFANGNAPEAARLNDQGKLAKDIQKDADPYGSPDNHPGFFGKLAHALGHATGGDTRRGWEEQGLAKQINTSLADESTNNYRNAETAGKEEETAEAPGKAASLEAEQGAQTENAQDEMSTRQAQLGNAYAHRLKAVMDSGGDPNTDAPMQHILAAMQAQADATSKPAAEQGLGKTTDISTPKGIRTMGYDPKTGKFDIDNGPTGYRPPVTRIDNGAHEFAEQERGRGLLDKAEGSYRTAQQGAQGIRAAVDDAMQGGKMSARMLPLEGALEITTANGVHRINRTEVDQYAGGGSLFDRLQGALRGGGTGIPFTNEIMQDMKHLADLQEKGAYDNYKGAYDSASQRYHLSDEKPLPGPGGGGGALAPAGPPQGADVQVKGQDGKMYWGNSKTKQVLGAVQ